MITKFIRKKNQSAGLPFSKTFARVQVHANGSLTFKFNKTVNTIGNGTYLRPDGSSKYLRPDGNSLYLRP